MKNTLIEKVSPKDFISIMRGNGLSREDVLLYLHRTVDMIAPTLTEKSSVYPYLVNVPSEGFKVVFLSNKKPEDSPEVDEKYASLYDVARVFSH